MIAVMACLAPTLIRFNRLCSDVVTLRDSSLPTCFYDAVVVDFIRSRYQAELSWRDLVC